MQIKQIGTKFNPRFIPEIDFESDYYFLDLDILIVDTEYIINNFSKEFEYKRYADNYCTSDLRSKEFLNNCEEKGNQILKFLNNGGTLFIYNSNLSKLEYYSIKEINSNEETIHKTSLTY
jgi:hypothetical protein